MACGRYDRVAGYRSTQAPAAQLAIHIHSERAMFQVLISPGTVGTFGSVLQLMAGDGELKDDFDVPARPKGP